jgi:hypothetical protein
VPEIDAHEQDLEVADEITYCLDNSRLPTLPQMQPAPCGVIALTIDDGVTGKIIAGSPHGGLVYELTLRRLPDDEARTARLHIRNEYDTVEAEHCDLTLEEFREHLLSGTRFEGYHPYPTDD